MIMSREIGKIENTGGRLHTELGLSEFSGGVEGGRMLQLTQGFGTNAEHPDEPGFLQLTQGDVYSLMLKLGTWLKACTENRRKQIEGEIAKYEVLKKTICQDAVECERFIQDLKILEIPLRLLELTQHVGSSEDIEAGS